MIGLYVTHDGGQTWHYSEYGAEDSCFHPEPDITVSDEKMIVSRVTYNDAQWTKDGVEWKRLCD